jgi:hypothetical protein
VSFKALIIQKIDLNYLLVVLNFVAQVRKSQANWYIFGTLQTIKKINTLKKNP